MKAKESLLVVEENEIIQALFSDTFARKGYRLFRASSPEQALRIYRQQAVDLVLTNVNFKAASALDFLYDLKRLDSDVAVLVLASYLDLEIAQKAIAFGIYDLISVPFELDHVVSSVRKALEKKMLLDRNKDLIEKQASLIERLHRSYKQLKELDQLKSDFLVTISHELLTPLTSIKALTYNFLHGVVGTLDKKQTDYAELIREDADRLEEILKDILNFSKLEAGKIELKREAVDVKTVIAKVVRALKPVAAGKGVSLDENGLADLPQARADRSRLEEIIANLVDNAIKYTPSGGKILVGAREGENSLVVNVRDTGIGIARDHLNKIFSRFTQFHRDQGPGSHGVGLGLAIVKKLVELHNGNISVESEVGKGTTFTFSIPRYPGPSLFPGEIDHG